MLHATNIRENRLWLGSHQAYDEVVTGNSDNITAILCVAMDYFPKVPLHPAQIKYVQVSLGDGIDNPPAQVQMALSCALNMYNNNERLLIHCISGVSRSAFICANLLSTVENRDYDDVYVELKKLRPQIQVPSFMDIRAHQVGV